MADAVSSAEVARNPTGRPSRIYDRVPVIETDQRTGQRVPSGRDESLVDVIVRSVRAGATVADACGAIYPPITKATHTNWMRRGRAETERLERARAEGLDTEVDEREAVFVDFVARVEAARNEAKVEALVAVRRAIVGFDDVETTTTVVESPVTLTDAAGVQHVEMLSKTTVVTKRARRFSWQAAMTFLERRYGVEYARRVFDQAAIDAAAGDDDGKTSEGRSGRAVELLDQLEDLRGKRALAVGDATTDSESAPETPNALPD